MDDDNGAVDRLMADLTMAYRRRRRRHGERYGHLPWWSLSLAVHIALLMALGWARYGYIVEEPPRPPLAINLIPADREPKDSEPEPPEPEPPDPDTDLPEEPGPPSPLHPPDPGPKLPRDTRTVTGDARPTTADPSAASPTQILAVEARERGYAPSIFARRSSAGRSRAVGRRGGSTVHTERAVDAGLMWLAKVQERDGRWACKDWGGRDDYDVGMTSLALLALLGAGHTHQKGAFRSHVARGLAWLQAHQQTDGRFAWLTFYEQGMAAMAACEAFGLTRDLRFAEMAQAGLLYICRVQPEHGGFRYEGPVDKAGGDLSVTGWQILALRSGICAELDVPDEALERTRTFLANTARDDGGSAYVVRDPNSQPAMTAIGMLSRQFVGGEGYEDEIRAAAAYLIRYERRVRGPGRGKNRLVGDLYYTYYSTLAMFQFGGDHWLAWNRLFRDALLAQQVRDRYDAKGRYVRGSWDPANHNWGGAGGRVYTTAMAVMSLGVYYRYLPVYRR